MQFVGVQRNRESRRKALVRHGHWLNAKREIDVVLGAIHFNMHMERDIRGLLEFHQSRNVPRRLWEEVDDPRCVHDLGDASWCTREVVNGERCCDLCSLGSPDANGASRWMITHAICAIEPSLINDSTQCMIVAVGELSPERLATVLIPA